MLKNYVLLIGIGVIWGSQFIFQNMALDSFPPIWIGALRATIGALTLLLICWGMGIKALKGTSWWVFALIGALEAAIPFFLVPWGQQNIPSSVASILMGTIPFYVVILAPFLLKNVSIGRHNVLSILVGFSALIVLFYPELAGLDASLSLLHAGAVLAAAMCFAMALVLLNKVQNEHPLIVSRNVLIMASIQLLVIAFVIEPTDAYNITMPALLSLLQLGILGAGVVYYLYMTLISRAGAVFTSLSNYLIPTVGVLCGALLNHESIQPTTWSALAIILLALSINYFMGKRAC